MLEVETPFNAINVGRTILCALQKGRAEIFVQNYFIIPQECRLLI